MQTQCRHKKDKMDMRRKRGENMCGENMCTEKIGFCYSKVYCMDCKKEIGYNSCNPYNEPLKCNACGGIMVHNEAEEISIKDIENHIKKAIKKSHSTVKPCI